MEGGEWKVVSGGWKVAGGRWRVEGGEWRVVSGGSEFKMFRNHLTVTSDLIIIRTAASLSRVIQSRSSTTNLISLTFKLSPGIYSKTQSPRSDQAWLARRF